MYDMNWGKCIFAMPFLLACSFMGKDEGFGELRLSFLDSGDVVHTRALESVPDTSDFQLSVKDSKGNSIYYGKYGDCPESISVKSGSYEVRVVSKEFSTPAFASPQFGDEQCVIVPSGGNIDVRLLCRQMNSGVKLKVDSGFLEAYPGGVLFLKSVSGKLMYGYSEKRVAYFPPGSVSLILDDSGREQVLLTRTLMAQENLVLKVSAAATQPDAAPSGGKSSRISVAIDTSRFWMSEEYVIGGETSKGSSSENALTVSQALSAVGEKGVWVSGYIVGGDLTSTSASFDVPFKSRTNMILGPRSTSSSRASCLSVQLPSGGLRDDLNLVDNPDLHGRKVCLKGDIVESYFGMTGIKNISGHVLK